MGPSISVLIKIHNKIGENEHFTAINGILGTDGALVSLIQSRDGYLDITSSENLPGAASDRQEASKPFNPIEFHSNNLIFYSKPQRMAYYFSRDQKVIRAFSIEIKLNPEGLIVFGRITELKLTKSSNREQQTDSFLIDLMSEMDLSKIKLFQRSNKSPNLFFQTVVKESGELLEIEIKVQKSRQKYQLCLSKYLSYDQSHPNLKLKNIKTFDVRNRALTELAFFTKSEGNDDREDEILMVSTVSKLTKKVLKMKFISREKEIQAKLIKKKKKRKQKIQGSPFSQDTTLYEVYESESSKSGVKKLKDRLLITDNTQTVYSLTNILFNQSSDMKVASRSADVFAKIKDIKKAKNSQYLIMFEGLITPSILLIKSGGSKAKFLNLEIAKPYQNGINFNDFLVKSFDSLDSDDYFYNDEQRSDNEFSEADNEGEVISPLKVASQHKAIKKELNQLIDTFNQRIYQGENQEEKQWFALLEQYLAFTEIIYIPRASQGSEEGGEVTKYWLKTPQFYLKCLINHDGQKKEVEDFSCHSLLTSKHDEINYYRELGLVAVCLKNRGIFLMTERATKKGEFVVSDAIQIDCLRVEKVRR